MSAARHLLVYTRAFMVYSSQPELPALHAHPRLLDGTVDICRGGRFWSEAEEA